MIEQRLRATLGHDCRLAVARVPDAMRGEGVLVALEAAGRPRLDTVRAAARAVLADLGVAAGGALHVTTVEALPVTATGKVRRTALSDQFVAGSAAPTAPALAEGAPRTPREAELVKAIEAAMGIAPISIHASFFDLGGDSLSAINLIIRVEQLGVAKPDVRAFLDGRTIAEIAAGETDGDVRPVERRPTLYLSDAINATRGLFVLVLIAIHWLPGLIGMIPGVPYEANVWLNPFYRFGTPSFAMVFGVGVGFFFFHGLAQDRARVWKTIRFALALLGGGMLVMALFRFLGIELSGQATGAPLFSRMFYSVLAFYFLAVASIPLWYAVLRRWRNRVLAALWASLACFALDGLIAAIMPAGSGSGPFDLAMLMLRSKYSYFGMAGIVMLGVAVGTYLRELLARPDELDTLPGNLASAGGLLLTLGILLPIQLGIEDEWFSAGTDSGWTLPAYFGVVLMMLAVMIRFSRSVRSGGFAVAGFRVLTVVGLLSLVMFVGHEVVLPARVVLVALGLPNGVSLTALVLLFVGLAALLVGRIYRFYYGSSGAVRRETEVA
jgi:acyl carrier protein